MDQLTQEEKERLVQIATGVFVERDVLGIVQRILEYDPNLRVKYVNPEEASISDAPYMITELCPDGLERVVLRVNQLDERVMERLYAADNVKNNVLVSVDGHNNLIELENQRRFREEKDEANDIVSHYLSSRKGRWSFRDPKTNKHITLDDQEGIPANVSE